MSEDGAVRSLDFAIIGAQKCGTTSLARYLGDHPMIHVPRAKELPFFNAERVGRADYCRFMDEYYAGAPQGVRLGKATPQYLVSPVAARNIVRLAPSMRLICILRNPVDRAISHYRMERRRGLENRELDQALSDELERRVWLDDNNPQRYEGYVAGGLYGSQVGHYARFLLRSRLKFVFTAELAEAPDAVLAELYRFIGVDPTHHATNTDVRYRMGADQARVSARSINLLKKSRLARGIWKRMPARYRRALWHEFDRWNAVGSDSDLRVSSLSIRRELNRVYAADALILESHSKQRAPWTSELES